MRSAVMVGVSALLCLLLSAIPVSAQPDAKQLDAHIAGLIHKIEESNRSYDSHERTRRFVFNRELLKYFKDNGSSCSLLGAPLPRSQKEGLQVVRSADGRVRFYTWDTELGGSMHFFWSVAQYRGADNRCRIALLNPKQVTVADDHLSTGWWYKALDQVKTTAGKQIYLVRGTAAYSGLIHSCVMQSYSIVGGRFSPVQIFKAGGKTTAEIGCTTDDSPEVTPWVELSKDGRTAFEPIAAENGKLTKEHSIYTFDGTNFVFQRRE